MNDAPEHLRAFLDALGLDDDVDEHLASTPERVTEMLTELFEATTRPAPTMSTFDAETTGPIYVVALPFRSMCVHHLVPFFGTIDIAYDPGDTIAGFGSFGRVVDWAARRPQLQERMVEQIADVVADQLQPNGLLIRSRARQMCVEMRSGRTGEFLCSATRGELQSHDAAIRQFVAAESPL